MYPNKKRRVSSKLETSNVASVKSSDLESIARKTIVRPKKRTKISRKTTKQPRPVLAKQNLPTWTSQPVRSTLENPKNKEMLVEEKSHD